MSRVAGREAYLRKLFTLGKSQSFSMGFSDGIIGGEEGVGKRAEVEGVAMFVG